LAAVHTSTTYHNFNIASDVFTFDNWRWGWVAGFGAEWACSERVSLRSEVLYVDAADRTFTFVSPTLGPGNFTHGDAMWIARVGINVKLGDDSVVGESMSRAANCQFTQEALAEGQAMAVHRCALLPCERAARADGIIDERLVRVVPAILRPRHSLATLLTTAAMVSVGSGLAMGQPVKPS